VVVFDIKLHKSQYFEIQTLPLHSQESFSDIV